MALDDKSRPEMEILFPYNKKHICIRGENTGEQVKQTELRDLTDC